MTKTGPLAQLVQAPSKLLICQHLTHIPPNPFLAMYWSKCWFCTCFNRHLWQLIPHTHLPLSEADTIIPCKRPLDRHCSLFYNFSHLHHVFSKQDLLVHSLYCWPQREALGLSPPSVIVIPNTIRIILKKLLLKTNIKGLLLPFICISFSCMDFTIERLLLKSNNLGKNVQM